MAIREYKCTSADCNAVTEKVVMGEPDKTTRCPRCGTVAELKVYSTVNVARAGESNAPIDIIIGKDAEMRWNDIHSRQEIRDNVREQSGTVGLTSVGRNEFAPISSEHKALRTEVTAAVESSGYGKVEED